MSVDAQQMLGMLRNGYTIEATTQAKLVVVNTCCLSRRQGGIHQNIFLEYAGYKEMDFVRS